MEKYHRGRLVLIGVPKRMLVRLDDLGGLFWVSIGKLLCIGRLNWK